MEKGIGRSEQIISNILRFGSGLSIFLMLGGLGLFVIEKHGLAGIAAAHFMGLRRALAGCLALNPIALMTTGILVLLLTPFFRVVGAFFSFLLVEKDTTYAVVSLGVLLILTASFFIPGFK